MEPQYIIAWKHKTDYGQKGMGRHRLNKKDAEQLAAELNRDHPNFEHTAVLAADRPTPDQYPSHD